MTNRESGQPPGAPQRQLRAAVAGVAVLLAAIAFVWQDVIPGRLRAGVGIACFALIVIACSADIRAIRWRTVAWGFAFQVVLAVFILRFEVAGVRPGYVLFSGLAAVVTQFSAGIHERWIRVRVRSVGEPSGDGTRVSQRLGAGVRSAADHHLCVVGVYRAVPPGCPTIACQDDGAGDDAGDGYERRGDPGCRCQRIHWDRRRRRSSSSRTSLG